MIQSGGLVPLQTRQPICQLITLMFSGVELNNFVNKIATKSLHTVDLSLEIYCHVGCQGITPFNNDPVILSHCG